jgi:hypothetical protein
MRETVKHTNYLIRNFMGYKYHEIVDIDYSDCGGIYTKTHVYSKVPIPVKKYPDQHYLEDHWVVGPGDVIYGELKYHKSWDWLMPVIEQIESLKYRTFMTYRKSAEGMFHQMVISDSKYDYDTVVAETLESAIDEEPHIVLAWIEEAENKTKIQAAYRAVINFIKYYNQINLIKEVK